MENNKQNLAETFERYFSVELADNEEKKRLAYAIRYQVYCKEFPYELPELFSEELEYDDYDARSQHCLIIHRQTKRLAGCVRLIPALGTREKDPLPFEKYCQKSLYQDKIEQLAPDRSKICEISRLVVEQNFRKREHYSETLTRFGDCNALDISEYEQRTFSLVALACILCATAMTERSARTHVFAMMEPYLPQVLHKSGFLFERVGQNMDYHGIRAAYFITTQSVVTNMHPELRGLYQWIKTCISINT